MTCGPCTAKTAKITYIHTDSAGKKQTYSSEIEAKAAVVRRGGSYKAQ